MPPRFLVAGVAGADCQSAAAPTGGLEAGFLIADRACDANEVPAKAGEIGAEAAVPQRLDRKVKREIDLHLYR